MEAADALTKKEGKRLARHLKFGERVRRHPWIPAALIAVVVLVGVVYAASAAASGFKTYQKYMATVNADELLDVHLLGIEAMASAARTGTNALVAFFFVAMALMLRQSLKDHILIVKLHGLAQAAGSKGREP